MKIIEIAKDTQLEFLLKRISNKHKTNKVQEKWNYIFNREIFHEGDLKWLRRC